MTYTMRDKHLEIGIRLVRFRTRQPISIPSRARPNPVAPVSARFLPPAADTGLAATGFDVRPPSDFGDMRLIVTDDANSFAASIETLITVVRDIPQTEEVLFGAQGFAFAPRLERIIVSSTLSPSYVTGLRARVPGHVKLLDAPMSGAQVAAEEQRLTFMVGGSDAEIDEAMPLFMAMGKRIHRMGAFGSNWFASGFDQIEFARDGYSDDNTIGILVKDIDSALDAAPPDADLSLPETLRVMLSNLPPME